MNLRRISTLTSTVLAGVVLMTGCTQGPANATSNPSKADSPSAAATKGDEASASPQARQTPVPTSGSGTQADPYVATVTTSMKANLSSVTYIYGEDFTNLARCVPEMSLEGNALMPDGTSQRSPWMRRDANYVQFNDSVLTFTPDGASAPTAPTCVNGSLTYSWQGYTSAKPTLLSDGSYYMLTYAAPAPTSAHVAYTRGWKVNAAVGPILGKNGKPVAKRHAFNPKKAKAWRTAFYVYDWANKPLTVQKRTSTGWKNFRTFRTNSKSVAQITLPGTQKDRNEVYLANDNRAKYRVVVPGNAGWSTSYSYLNGNLTTSWH